MLIFKVHSANCLVACYFLFLDADQEVQWLREPAAAPEVPDSNPG